MAENRVTFIKSKMNKDLDDRIVPSGEYRDAQNVAVSRSEDADVGALENVLGNLALSDFGLDDHCGIEAIGYLMDEKDNRIFVFLTNYTDNSTDRLSNYCFQSSNQLYPSIGPYNEQCWIAMYDFNSSSGLVLVAGNWLNFSKTHPITGVNLLEDLLFWTDNRNQPRKINVTNAINDPFSLPLPNGEGYYHTEDHISVAKLYPWQPISLLDTSAPTLDPDAPFESTMKDVVSPYLPDTNNPFLRHTNVGADYTNGSYVTGTTTTGSGTGLEVGVYVTGGSLNTTSTGYYYIAVPGSGYVTGDVITANDPGGLPTTPMTFTYQDGVWDNPYYDPSWVGDSEFLKDKFVRFSYRFKFDDGEYSLIAPFTQLAFVPNQDGYFIDEDMNNAYKSTEVAFFRNKVNQIQLNIPAPTSLFYQSSSAYSTLTGEAAWSDVFDQFKITEVDILYKESNGLSIKVIETIKKETFGNTSSPILEYVYDSKKPYKTLPNKEVTRVSDRVPVRALAQEIIGNRVVYSNYQGVGSVPSTLDYSVSISDKGYSPLAYQSVEQPQFSKWNNIKEYQNHTLKQNRTYKVGIVLCDRYGRQSPPIFSSFDETNNNGLGSTVYSKYKTKEFIETGQLANVVDTWPGDEMDLTFYNPIPTDIIEKGYPGLLWGDPSFSGNVFNGSWQNPLGWCTAKVVVKQTQQEYYNVYFPGILSGTFDAKASATNPQLHIVLQSDNINKIPRSLQEIGPEQKIFRTYLPKGEKADLEYVEQWILNSGQDLGDLTIFNESVLGLDSESLEDQEVKAILEERNRLKVQVGLETKDNSSMEMWLRVTNKYNNTWATPSSKTISAQFFPQPANSNLSPADTVTLVGKASELGLYRLDTSSDPTVTIPEWAEASTFDWQTNPIVAKIKPNSTEDLQTWGVESLTGTRYMIPQLAVYETKPVESRLDLYWETASLYPITWLNTQIMAEDFTSPMFIMDYISTGTGTYDSHWFEPYSIFNEADVIGEPVTRDFCMVNPAGGTGVVLVGTMELVSVMNGQAYVGQAALSNAVDVTSSFKLVSGSVANTWTLKTEQLLYAAPTASTYQFTIRCTVAGVPEVSKDISFNAYLGNTNATIVDPPATPFYPSGFADIKGGLRYTLQAINGTAKTTENNQDIHWEIVSQIVDSTGASIDYFYLVQDSTAGKIQLWNRAVTSAEASAGLGVFKITIKAKDRPWTSYFEGDTVDFYTTIS